MFLDWFNQVWKVRAERDRGGAGARRPGPSARGGAVARGCATRSTCSRRLLDGRDHLFGDDFSAADCAAFPFLKYAKLRDPEDDELFHRILEDNLQLDGELPRLSAWIDRVNERPRA